MKKLLGMAREKKEKEVIKPISSLNLSKNQLQQQHAYRDLSEPSYEDGMEVSEE
jgi:hypothetical protein